VGSATRRRGGEEIRQQPCGHYSRGAARAGETTKDTDGATRSPRIVRATAQQSSQESW